MPVDELGNESAIWATPDLPDVPSSCCGWLDDAGTNADGVSGDGPVVCTEAPWCALPLLPVALDAVRSASRRAGVDYLEDGFVAKRRADEVATESYECWITRRCEDVSAAVVEAAGAEADPLKRALAFRDAALKTAKDREAGEAGGARCEVKACLLYTSPSPRD